MPDPLHDPFLWPDWRVRRAQTLMRSVDMYGRPARASRGDDADMVAYRNYCIRYERAVSDPRGTMLKALQAEAPVLALVHQLITRRGEPQCAWTPLMIECDILAGESDEAIAA